MKPRRCALQPFPPAGPVPAMEITGAIARRDHILALHYVLRGPLPELVIPPPAPTPSRRHRLWEETCFEFFLAPPNLPRYWEFNLSPAGHWNVYRFAGYRRGLQEETAFTSLPFSVQNRPDSVGLSLELEVGKIIPAGAALEVAIAAVVKLAGGETTYWALTHPGPRPDFHRRDSFIIGLADGPWNGT
jgi:hypothetical protein